jgi:hypothetical protein
MSASTASDQDLENKTSGKESYMRSISLATMLLCLVSLFACSSEETVDGGADATASAPADPVSGTWTGDWGPSEAVRNLVNIDLTWDGTRLMGTLNPGPSAVAITTGSFAPDTGTLTMEANGNGNDGKLMHYTIEGQLVEGVISGTWMDGDKKNDFKLKKS